MYSRHGMALLGTVRWFSPPPFAESESQFLNGAPWDSVLNGWDIPSYSLLPADSGDLPIISELPTTESGQVPLSGTPTSPIPVRVPGGVAPGSASPPDSFVYEDGSGNLIVGDYVLDNVRYWRLELRTSGGSLVSYLDSHWRGRAVFNVDQSPEMSFCTDSTYLDDPSTMGTREVWLRDWRRHLMGRFEIVDVERVYDGPARYYSVTCQGLTSRLSRESVADYSTPVTVVTADDGSETRTRHFEKVSVIVAELLALQTRTPKITVGRIDPAIGDLRRIFSVEDVSIMDALRQLQSTMRRDRTGFLWVDDQLKLQWRQTVGVATQTLSSALPAPCLRGATVRMGLGEMATRVYLYGGLTSTDRFLSLEDAGLSVPYVEANTGTYGVRSLRRVDNRIKYPETLLEAARSVLEESSVPCFEVEVDAVDLSKADGDYGVVDLWPGTAYVLDDAVADPLVGVRLKAQSVTYDLSNPLATQLKLSNRTRRLSDILERIVGQLNPTTDETTLLESWEAQEDDEGYPAHFDRMLDRLLKAAVDDPESGVGESIADAFTDLIETYVPDFTTDSGPNLNNIADALQDHETRIQDLEDGTVEYGEATDIKPVVPLSAVAGTSDRVARADHQHVGTPILTGESAPTVPETPALWFETDSEDRPLRLYMSYYNGSTFEWRLLSELEAEGT